MALSHTRSFVLTCTCIVAFGALVSIAFFLLRQTRETERRATLFFEDALHDAHTYETVLVNDTVYTVSDGSVTAHDEHTPTARETLRALRLTYALTLARRNPLFGVAGTDPTELLRATERLARIQNDIALLQDTPEAIERVKTSLYPIDFLRTLASLEVARQSLLSSPSESHVTTYERALASAIHAGSADARRFRDALAETIGDSHRTYIDIGRSFATRDMLHAAELLAPAFADKEQLQAERRRCLTLSISECRESDLMWNTISTETVARPQATSVPSTVLEVEALFNEASGRAREGDERYVALSKSVCLMSESTPHYFSVWTRHNDGKPTFAVKYRGDLFFFPLASSTEGSLGHLAYASFGTDFLHLNPTMFYLCPEIGRDQSIARTIINAAQYADRNPDVARAERALFLADPLVLYEDAARAYVQAASARIAGSSDGSIARRDLEDLVLQFRAQGAGLEYLVDDMARRLERNATFHASGTPAAVDTDTLFLSRHAFPSLFLTHSPLGAHVPRYAHVLDNELRQTATSKIQRYSDMLRTIPREKIITDLRAILKLEDDLYIQAP